MARPKALRAVLLAVLVLGMLSIVLPPASAQFAGSNGKTIFSSDLQALGGPHDLYTINPDGSGLHNLTNTPNRDEGRPSYNSDGTMIVFRRTDAEGNADIWTMWADGSHQRRVHHNPAFESQPGWSPDSMQIVFTSDRGLGLDIYLINADGTGLRRLTRSKGFDGDPEFSPDGSKILFGSHREGHEALYTMNPDGRDVIRLTPLSLEAGSGDYSPDAESIVFNDSNCISCSDSNIWVMRSDGRAFRQLTFTADDNELYPIWSPDGRFIAFMSGPIDFSSAEIVTIRARGGARTNVTQNPASTDVVPGWQPVP
jgi:Tol biopolymer transport system component